MSKYMLNVEKLERVLNQYGLKYNKSTTEIFVIDIYGDRQRVGSLGETNNDYDNFVTIIKKGLWNSDWAESVKLLIAILHPHFDEVFTKPQYSLEKLQAFLKGLNYKTDDSGVYYNSYYKDGRVQKNGHFVSWKYIIGWLNNIYDIDSKDYDSIFTLLENNKDKFTID